MRHTSKLVGLLLLLILAGPAWACFPVMLSLDTAGDCAVTTTPYVSNTLQLRATVLADLDGVSSITLKAADWPGSPGYPEGEIFEAWYADDVVGDIETALTLSWDPPLAIAAGEDLLLGEMEVLSMAESWPGTDAPLSFDGSLVDANAQEFDALRANFTFNCTGGDCDCHPTGGPLSWLLLRDLTPPAGDSVSDTFPLAFTVESHGCLPEEPMEFTGLVQVEGGPQFVIGGTGETPLQFGIHAGHVSPGGELAVDILLENGEIVREARVVYVVEGSVGVEGSSFSVIKSLY